VTAAATGTSGVDCPDCGACIAAVDGWRVWCQRCEWNLVDPAPDPAPDRRWQRLREAFGRHSSEALSAEVRDTPLDRARRPAVWRSRSLLLAYAIAAAVNAGSVLTIGLAVWLWIVPWPNVFYVLGAVTLPLLALTLRPRPTPAPDAPIDRADAPALYEVTDRIADAMSTRRVAAIGSSLEFNANFRLAGWRGRPHIELGLPLMLLLDEAGRLGLLAHELSHGANGDPLRGRFLYAAVATLEQWAYVLRPSSIGSSAAGVDFGGPLASWAAVPIELAMLGLSRLIERVADTVRLLVHRESQRAEYWADRIAASVVGSEAMARGLRAMAACDAAQDAQQRAAFDGGIRDLPALLRDVRTGMPASEYTRIERIWRREHTQVDLTHPPTSLRLDMLRSTPQPAALTLPTELLAALQAELERLAHNAQRELTNRYTVR